MEATTVESLERTAAQKSRHPPHKTGTAG